MALETYKDFVVWQKGMDVAVKIYKLTSTFPGDEKYGLVSQMRRAAYSIPSNVAEGYGRKDSKDFTRFLRISLGSVYELQTQIEIVQRIGFNYDDSNNCSIINELNEIGKMLNSLISKRTNI